MPTPQEPEDEPARDEIPGEPTDGLDDASVEEALWRSIVENYGERPEISEPEIEVPPSPRDLASSRTPVDDPDGSVEVADSDHFVPPEPPPLTTPPPARLLAWLGLFGVPIFVLVALVAGLAVPSWIDLLLLVWFVGGFVFLVSSMRPGPGEDHDDGARL